MSEMFHRLKNLSKDYRSKGNGERIGEKKGGREGKAKRKDEEGKEKEWGGRRRRGEA